MHICHPKSGACLAILIALPLCLQTAVAEIYDAAELQPPLTGSGPTMANFYSVNPNGESAPEDPVASGFALSTSGSFDPAQQEAERDDAENKSGNGNQTRSTAVEQQNARTVVKISGGRKSKQSFLKSYAEVRCERHGFFYTSNGRCVAPATRRVLHHSPAHPVRPFPTMPAIPRH